MRQDELGAAPFVRKGAVFDLYVYSLPLVFSTMFTNTVGGL
jgi:hypothetical protein